MSRRLVLLVFLLLAGCWTDPATRLAYDLEAGASRTGRTEGATYTLQHRVPSKSGECAGPYRVQLDRVGAIIVWCKDASGTVTVSSHSTSYHARFVETPRTYVVDKPGGESLIVGLERHAGRVQVTGVR